jgi:hypothetical protein
MKRFLYFSLFLALLTVACGGTAPAAKPVDTALPPPPATDTIVPTIPPPTATNTPTPTDTAVPTITPTTGPIIIDDDFSTDNGLFKCDFCKVSDGALLMGPYPIELKGNPYFAICSKCGTATNYKMSVDTWYIEGASDRGFGLLLRENDGKLIDLEVSTWQVYGVWTYDPTIATTSPSKGWGAITDGWVEGWLKPGRAVNHVDVLVKTENNQMTVTVTINNKGGRTLKIDSGSGNVGILVGMHSLGVAFDNFHFEELP